MRQYEFNVYVETLTIWAKDEEEAEAQYVAHFETGECLLHRTPFRQCHCIEVDETVGHTIEEVPSKSFAF